LLEAFGWGLERGVKMAGAVTAVGFSLSVLNGNSTWKLPLVARVFGGGRFSGKNSTPYGDGDNVHDFMHAKATVADDHVFTGSYNLSHSGEQNAENVVEIRDADLAEFLARWIDQVRDRYGPAPIPELAAAWP
jgi:phosphatidylserine/phosphatidylglycerophosphate/cardiolipin synthase-like enzyme